MKLKKFIQFNENMDMDDMTHHGETEHTNYMFFENLKTIKRLVDKLLEMDEVEIDEIIDSGHDWAADHIAVAKVDVEQVFDFLMNNTQDDMHEDDDDMEDYMSIMQGDVDMSDMTDMEDVDDSEDYEEEDDYEDYEG
jgi:hypothetical protein